MINNVTLTGRLTKDVELRYTPTSNQPIVRFTLAVQRRMPNKQTGQRESDFISCTTFGKTAEILAQYTRKGSLIGVEGNIRTGRYENQQGQTVYTTDVIVNSFTFLESRNDTQQRTNQAPSYPNEPKLTPQPEERETPREASFEVNQGSVLIQGTEFKNPVDTMNSRTPESPFDISDSDLPF